MAQTLFTDLVTLIRAEWLNDADAVVFNALSAVSGTNTIVGTGPTTATAYAANQRFFFTPANTNTGATTLNVSSIGPKNVFWNGAACVGGELRANIPVLVIYDGTQFHIIARGFNAPFLDTHAIVEGSADSTKKVRIEADGLTTATTRVWTAADLDIAIGKQPTRQVLTSGSGTYTTPSGATRINVRLIGAGGGGGAQITNSGATGGNTTFSTLTGSGGTGGITAGGHAGNNGGAAAGGDINIPGGSGSDSGSSGAVSFVGGKGGSGAFGGSGGGGANAQNGNAAATNSGGGGGGGGGNANAGGGGGGAGGYVEKLITAPAATYSYAVGALGAGGAAGTQAGGNGAAGIIIVDEYYN